MERRAAGFAILIACGGDAQQTPTRPPPAAVLAMQIRVDSAGDETFCPSLEQGLRRSNLAIAASDAQADAVVTCRAFASENTGLFRFEYNGQRKMHYTVRVDVRGASGQGVDSFVAEYNAYERNPPDEDVVSKVVLGFAYSQRIAAYARGVQRAKASGAVTQPSPQLGAAATATSEVAPPPADRRDDQAWFAIDTVKCKIPARVEACDGVRRYLQRFPSGAHAQEANAILSAAQPALEKLQKDDVGWQKANHAECSRQRTADACVGVEAYTVQFPTGVHADEAHRLLRSAGVEK
jgi:hypothetical protein